MSLSLSTGLRACVRLSVLCVHVCTCACARARLCVRACARALARAASALACARLPSAPRASRPALEPTSRSKCYLALPSALPTHGCASGNQKARIESPACARGFARGVKARLAGFWFGVLILCASGLLYSLFQRPSLASVPAALSGLSCQPHCQGPPVPGAKGPACRRVSLRARPCGACCCACRCIRPCPVCQCTCRPVCQCTCRTRPLARGLVCHRFAHDPCCD